MDEGKTTCDCRICFGKENTVSRRTRKRHVDTYGNQDDINFQCPSEPDAVSKDCDSELTNQGMTGDAKNDNDNTYSSFSEEEEEESNMSWDDHHEENTLKDSDTESVNQSPVMSPISPLCSEESDDWLSSCSDTGDTDSDEETVCDKEEAWSLQYNKDLYASGIAVKNLKGTNLTVLQWLALNLYSFCNHPSMSKDAFSDTLRINQISNPANKDLLPSSYYEAKKMVSPYLIKNKSFMRV